MRQNWKWKMAVLSQLCSEMKGEKSPSLSFHSRTTSQALVVRRLGNAIHWINRYSVDKG